MSLIRTYPRTDDSAEPNVVFSAGEAPTERYLVKVQHSSDSVRTSLDRGFATEIRDIGNQQFEMTLEPGDQLFCKGVGTGRYIIARHPDVLVVDAIDRGFAMLSGTPRVVTRPAQQFPGSGVYESSTPDLLDHLRCTRDGQ